MNTYFTRSKSAFLNSEPNYNTRLQNRLRKRIEHSLNDNESEYSSHRYFTRSNVSLSCDIRSCFNNEVNSCCNQKSC